MSRKSVFMGLGIVLLVIGCVGAALAFLVGHEPGFYRRSAMPPGPVRKQNSVAFVSECVTLYQEIKNHDKPKWYATFTEAQINSYFEEDFIKSKTDQLFLPAGIASPRVAIEPDKMRLAFRYGQGTWSTVISIDLRVWLANKKPNVVALELQGLHAGSLPISAQSLLEHISEACQRNNIEVKWYRHNGNPVALLCFQSESPRPAVQLSMIELRKGLLLIGGCSINASTTPAALVSRLSQLTHHPQ